MTKLKNDTLIRALLREPVPYTPTWLMRQAGRYLPEYNQTRARAGNFLALCKNPVWPYWPLRLRTSSSHEEGAKRDWAVATKRLEGKNGKIEKLVAARLEWKDGKMQEVPGSEFDMKADLVLLAMGFVSPVQSMLDGFGVDKDARGNAKAATDGAGCYVTSVPKVFAAGDVRRGQSLVVWAIREGRQCARAVDEFLRGSSVLPR